MHFTVEALEELHLVVRQPEVYAAARMPRFEDNFPPDSDRHIQDAIRKARANFEIPSILSLQQVIDGIQRMTTLEAQKAAWLNYAQSIRSR